MKNILKNRTYLTLLIGDIVSNFGDIVFYLALMNYVLLLPNPEYAIAVITVSENIPILASFLLGHLADKTKNRVNKIYATLVFRAVLYVLVGIIMGFNPALWIVIVVAIINFLADIAGQYENSLYIPLSLKIVSNEEREQAASFRQTITMSTHIVIRSISALLVVAMSIQTLAYVNSVTFILALVIILTVAPQLKKIERDNLENEQEEQPVAKKENFLLSFKRNFIVAYRDIKKVPEIFATLMVAPLFNAIFQIIMPLTLFVLSKEENFVIISKEVTLAMIPTLITIAAVIGSILNMNVLKNLQILNTVKLMTILGVLMLLAMYMFNIYFYVFFLALMVVFSSALTPKLSAKIMNTLNAENLGLILGTLDTYLQFLGMVAGLIFAFAVTVLSLKTILLTVLGLAIILMVWVVFFVKVENSKE